MGGKDKRKVMPTCNFCKKWRSEGRRLHSNFSLADFTGWHSLSYIFCSKAIKIISSNFAELSESQRKPLLEKNLSSLS